MEHFTVPFDLVVTAQRVRSYKPRAKHFEEARKTIGPDEAWLHVAASLYHDIEPASKLSIDAVWVNRKAANSRRTFSGMRIKEVRNLTELTDWLKF